VCSRWCFGSCCAAVAQPTSRAGPRSMKDGRFHRKTQPRLNLTEPRNRSSLILYMSNPRSSTRPGQASPRHFVLAPRNLIILALAVLVLVLGYLTLRAGHPSAAAVILVFGYCVLFPVGIAL